MECSRWVLNQCTQLAVASSRSSTTRNCPSRRTHSVLQSPITDSARALSKLSPTEPMEATPPASASRLPYRMAQY